MTDPSHPTYEGAPMATARRRRTFELIALYATLAAGWVALSRRVVSPLLNRFFVGASFHDLDGSRLTVWRESLGAVSIAWMLHLVIVLFLRHWDDRRAEGRSPADAPRDRLVSPMLILITFVFLAVTVQTGAVHDYIFDLQIWSEIREGHDPWFLVIGIYGAYSLNAYGPLFNLLAGLAWVHPLAPKLLLAWAYCLTSCLLINELRDRRRLGPFATSGVMVWFWNPFPWVEIAIRGHFDILVGLACVAAVHARIRGRDTSSGISLALGVLLKYIPIVLLPFLLLGRDRYRPRLLVAALATISLGMGASYLVWGPSLFRPLTLAATRFSTLLSIFRYIRGQYSPFIAILGYAPNLDQFAVLILFLGLLRAWSWSRLHRPDPATAATLAILTTLLLYQNGFPQYQMVLFVVASYWVVRTWDGLRRRRALAVAMGLYFGWLALFDVVYCAVDFGQTRWEDAVGLPTFLLGFAFLTCLVRSSPSRRWEA